MIRASKLFLLCLVGILPSLVAIYLYRELSSVRKGIAKESSPSAKAEVWTCPMHLQYTSDKPGPCPICGMDLVPQRSLSQKTTPSLNLDSVQQSMIGLQTVSAKRAAFGRAIRTTGRIAYDETLVHHIHTKYEAYVEHLHANYVGKFVKKGEPIVALYSPELYSAEQEYLIARKAQAGLSSLHGGPNLVESAREKLLLWNLSPSDIAQLERSGRASRTFNLYAPISGYVIAKTAVHGMRIKPEDSLFDIVDLSRVWVLADVYEYELPRIEKGQTATITLPYWPDRTWQGQLSYIFPSVDPKTRTIRVRIEVDNPRGDLKADMFADVEVQVVSRDALVIPDDAVIETGRRKLVFVKDQEGKLMQRTITTGERSGHLYEVRAGLSEGEVVAKGASFLLDSEARLQGGTSDEETDTKAAPTPA
ncbi:MAG TPA: efflux RND transporter periplasmic adaptor subunit, partial [Pseudomonadota bacterium]|nr:efflux RND transporter periplasmic adaptor subunit [Pseudomonadota bacterium]